jgi:nitrite reductase/ring-hydroxylating ferredoxin subunit
MTEPSQSDKPDLRNGIADGDLADGAMLVDQFGDEQVRRGREVFAIGAACTHYRGPLGEGLMVADTERCPCHHACFSLCTGEALAAPALTTTSC